MKIVWSPTAVADLTSLRAYIAEHDPDAAASVARAIVEAVEWLRQFPDSGRPGRVPHTRELVLSDYPYLVPYTVRGNRIEVIAVLHTSRRWPNPETS